jgi:hypothetical protein
VFIEGSLIFDDNQDLNFDCTYMFIRGGSLIVGTADTPFQHKAILTFHGDRHKTLPLPVYGAKMLALRGGLLSMHGKARTPYFTHLDGDANKGATSVTVSYSGSGVFDWQEGDEIVISSTSFDYMEAEQRTLTRVDGLVLHFKEPLLNEHYGGVHTLPNGQKVSSTDLNTCTSTRTYR